MKKKLLIGIIVAVVAIVVMYVLLNNNSSNSKNKVTPKEKIVTIREKYKGEEALSSWGLINIKKFDLNGIEISSDNDKIYGIVMYPSYIDICLDMDCNQYEYTKENDTIKIKDNSEFKDDYLVSYDENKNMIWTVNNSEGKTVYYFAMPAG